MTTTKHEIETRRERPTMAHPNTFHIPFTMREWDQWVVWVWRWVGDRWTKVLKMSHVLPSGMYQLERASSTDPDTWQPFDTEEIAGLLALHEDRPCKIGLGFVISEADPFCVIDLDDCRDHDTGELTPEAWEMVRHFGTYTEVSPSGTGVKLFLMGTKPGPCCRRGKVEIYDRKRFVATTGQRVEGTPAEPQPRQEELELLYDRLFPETPQSAPSPRTAAPLNLTDSEVIERARAAGNGGKFERLFGGDHSDYDSRSSADLALACILTFWCGRDAGQVERIMRSSGLARPKWNRPDYLPRTIARAIASTSAVFGDRQFHPDQFAERDESPRQSKEKMINTTAAETPLVVVPVASESEVETLLTGLPKPPPPWCCTRGASGLLRQEDNPHRFRAVRYACSCWHCKVCRARLARSWAEHVALCALLASRQGCSLCIHDLAADGKEWSALRRKLNYHDVPWAALETAPRRLLVVAAYPAGMEGGLACGIEEIGRRLVSWAKTVRTWPEPFSRKRTRPVRTSKGWKLPEKDACNHWKHVATLAAARLDTILEVLSECGIKPTRVEDAIFAACNPLLGRSCCWCVEWMTSPEPECIGNMLERVTTAVDPCPVGGRVETEPIPW